MSKKKNLVFLSFVLDEYL